MRRDGQVWMALIFISTACPLMAQQTSGMTDAEVARETSDPASELWYLNTLIDATFEPGRSFSETGSFTLELQPSLPVPVAPGWRALNFPDLMLAVQGTRGGAMVTGVDSFSWMTALSPDVKLLGTTVGFGPTVSFPVSSNPAFGPAEWQFGFGGVFVHRSGSFLASAQVKSLWTTSGEGGGFLEIQYNIQYFIGNGWQVGLGRPRIEYTWDARGHGTWSLPVGVNVGRVVRLGRVPVKLMLEYEFSPINASQWIPEHMLRLMIVPVMDSPF